MSLRTGRFARETARAEQLAFIRRNWPVLLLMFLLVLAGTGAASAVIQPIMRGYVVGAGVASSVWIVVYAVVVWSGTAAKMMGAEAAVSTSTDLAILLSRGWQLVDELTFDGRFDIDHVLFGPGGVYAIETKWSGSSWYRDQRPTKYLLDCVAQAQRNSWTLSDRLRDAPSGAAVVASPVLVIRGPNRPADSVRQIDGVSIVPGHLLRAWCRALPVTGLEPRFVERVRNVLAHHEELAERSRQRLNAFVERGAQALLIDLGLSTAGAFAALASIGYVWQTFTGLASNVLALVGVLAVGFLALRIGRLRSTGIGWLAGTATIAALFAISTALDAQFG